jgi:hypothetical protein
MRRGVLEDGGDQVDRGDIRRGGRWEGLRCGMKENGSEGLCRDVVATAMQEELDDAFVIVVVGVAVEPFVQLVVGGHGQREE